MHRRRFRFPDSTFPRAARWNSSRRARWSSLGWCTPVGWCASSRRGARFVLLLPCVAVNVGVPTLCMSPLGPSPCSGVRGGVCSDGGPTSSSSRSPPVAGSWRSVPRSAFLAVGALPVRLSDKRAREGVRRGERAGPVAPAEHFFLASSSSPPRRVRRPHPAHSRGVSGQMSRPILRAVRRPRRRHGRLVARRRGRLTSTSHRTSTNPSSPRQSPNSGPSDGTWSPAPCCVTACTRPSSAAVDVLVSSRRGESSSRLKPHPVRAAVATVACFAASGAAHECIFWYLVGSPRVDGRWALFFLAQRPSCSARGETLERLAAVLRETPRAVAVAVALGAQFALATRSSFLRWPRRASAGSGRRSRLLFRK